MSTPGAPDDASSRLDDCLRRLGAELAQLLDTGLVDADELDAGTEQLQALVDSLLATADPARADLDLAVERGVRALVHEVPFPLVVRQRLGGALPPVSGRPTELEQAVRRALRLASLHAGSGGEVAVATRADGACLALEIQCRGAPEPHLRERALTLRAFVACMRGRCDIAVAADGSLSLKFELPLALELDRG